MAEDTSKSSVKMDRSDNPRTRRFRNYCEALGEFIDAFSSVEQILQEALMHYASVTDKVRRAVFSGVRVNDGISYLRRLAEVRKVPPREWTHLKRLLDRLSVINDRRNTLLHYGANRVHEGKGITTNAFVALKRERVTQFTVNPTMLRQMKDDLDTIYFGFWLRHVADRYRGPVRMRRAIQGRVGSPWRYTPPPPKRTRPPRRGKSAKQPPPQ